MLYYELTFRHGRIQEPSQLAEVNPEMNQSKHRFLFYAIIGLVFGVIDWFYLDWLAHISWGDLGESILVVPVIIALNYGIWLVPIIPVTINETRFSTRTILPMLAGMLTWSCAIFSYYFYYAILLSMGKLPNLEHLNIFEEKTETFWAEYWQMFNRIIMGQFLEWIIIALVGGAITGALACWLYHKFISPRFEANEAS
jgi:hypothetical protein